MTTACGQAAAGCHRSEEKRANLRGEQSLPGPEPSRSRQPSAAVLDSPALLYLIESQVALPRLERPLPMHLPTLCRVPLTPQPRHLVAHPLRDEEVLVQV